MHSARFVVYIAAGSYMELPLHQLYVVMTSVYIITSRGVATGGISVYIPPN